MVYSHIASYLKEKGIKQKAVADVINVSTATMSQILKGNRQLSADEFRDICKFLEVPAERFFD